MNQIVYTRLGKGVIIAAFSDGTYCVRLDSGGGAILMTHEIFTPIVKPVGQQASYAMAC